MAKGDKETYKAAVQEDRNKQQQRSDTFYNTLAEERPQIRARSNEERSYVTSGYRSIFENPEDGAGNIRGLLYDNGQNPNQPAGSLGNPPSSSSNSGGDSGGGSGGGGNSSPVAPPPPRYATEYDRYQNFADTGGVDVNRLRESLVGYNELNNENSGLTPTALADLNSNRASYGTMSRDGGVNRAITDENINRLREMRDSNIRLDPNIRMSVDAERARLAGYAETGGYDPTRLASARANIDGLSQIGADGGIPADQMARIRAAQSGFQEFAETGGYSAGDIANLRSRSNSQIPAMMSEQQRQMQQANRVSGGNSPNAAAVRARMFRDSARAQTDNVRDTEIGLKGAVNAGRQYGISGINASELSLGEMISKNRLAGYDAAAKYGNELEGSVANNRIGASDASGRLGLQLGDTEANINLNNRNQQMTAADTAMTNDRLMQEAKTRNQLAALNDSSALTMDQAKLTSGNRLAALSGISSTNQKAEELSQQGKLAGISGMYDVSKARAAEEMQKAAMDSAASSARYASDSQKEAANLATKLANERYLIDRMDNNRLAALSGLSGMYGTAPGELNAADRNQITMFGAGADASRNSLALEGSLYQGPSGMDRAMQFAGVGANVFRAFGGGGGNGLTSADMIRNGSNINATGLNNSLPSNSNGYDFNQPFLPPEDDGGNQPKVRG